MKTSGLFVLPLCFAAATAIGAEAITPTETIHLFNGRDLSNFYSFLVDQKYADPDRVFSVVDQIDGAPAIRISGQRWGSLITKQAYKNYRLVVEFRWGLATWGERKNGVRDSGVLVHCQGSDGNSSRDFNGPWLRSIECQVGEGIAGDFILVSGYDETGQRVMPKLTVRATKGQNGEYFYDPKAEPREVSRVNWSGHDPDWKDVLGFRGRHDVESPFGEWTRIEVICEGDSITNIVNGKVVNSGTNSSLTEGKILLQSEGAEVYYRRIDLEPLTR